MIDVVAERAASRERWDERANGKRAPSRTPLDIALEALRADPDADYREVLERVRAEVGWHDEDFAFARGPWRMAKYRERKERTGSCFHTKPEPKPRPAIEPEANTDTLRLLGAPILSHATPHGTLTVRREGTGYRLICSVILDCDEAGGLARLITGVMRDRALANHKEM